MLKCQVQHDPLRIPGFGILDGEGKYISYMSISSDDM